MGGAQEGRDIRVLAHRARLALASLTVLAGGCTTFKEWVHNGFKIGPNFQTPPAAVATQWIDGTDPRVIAAPVEAGGWWNVFNDPTLVSLIETAYRQNLDLKTAGTRVLAAQAQRNMEAGNLFPQTQRAIGDYAHAQIGRNLNLFDTPRAPFPKGLNTWLTGFNASWELDFWGHIRRSIESASASRDASIEAYNAALVTLTADVATNYVQIRTLEERIEFARSNVQVQRGSLELAEARLKDGMATELDVKQARSSLAQTESSIPPLLINLRQANNRLCVLLGLPPQDLVASLNDGSIPTVPPELAVGVPAELLERRPDVRQALREAAAQCAQIGVAEADFYPQIGVTGFIGYAASDIRRLFAANSFLGLILPNFQWKILNYGRIRNNVRSQNAQFQAQVLEYQQTVLKAGQEVEDALIAFLQYQVQAKSLEVSVKESSDSVELVHAQYKGGIVDFNRVFTTQGQLVILQDQLASARGNIALSAIAVYRALGGGWQCQNFAVEPSIHPAADAAQTLNAAALPAALDVIPATRGPFEPAPAPPPPGVPSQPAPAPLPAPLEPNSPKP